MPPFKQPARVDELAAASFARFLFGKCLAIELLKKDGSVVEANLMLEREKLRCTKLPAVAVGRYIQHMFKVIYSEAVKVLPLPVMETMFSCMVKPGMMVVDMSGLCDKAGPIVKTTLCEVVPRMDNLRVAILRDCATDEVLQLLCKHCPLLEELDISKATLNFEAFKFFGVKGVENVHGCPNLARLDMFHCDHTPEPPAPSAIVELMKRMEKLEEFGYEGLNGVLLWMLEKRQREAMEKKGSQNTRMPPYISLYGDQDPISAVFFPRDMTEVPPPVYGLKDLRIRCSVANLCRLNFSDFVVDSFPGLESIAIESRSEYFIGALDRLPHLTKLTISVPFISPEGLLVRRISKKLTNLEITVGDLMPLSLVAIAETCTNLTEFKITVAGSHRMGGKFPEIPKDAFRKLETLKYFTTHPKAAVSQREWVYLTSNAVNLVHVTMRSNADFMTDEFWANFLTNVNQLKRLETVIFGSIDLRFPMGKPTLDAFLGSCPSLITMAASFDLQSFPNVEVGKIREKMKEGNVDFGLTSL